MSAEHLYGLPLRPTKMGLGLKEIWRIEKKKNIKKLAGKDILSFLWRATT